MGDFTTNLLNSDTNPQVFEFFNNLCLHLFPYNPQHTRLPKNSKTLIGNIFF